MAKFVPDNCFGLERRQSKTAEYRQKMFENVLPQIKLLAWEAIHLHNNRNTDIVIVCIQKCPAWQQVIDVLEPDLKWKKFQYSSTIDLFAYGCVDNSICDYLQEREQRKSGIILQTPSEGMVKVVILSDSGWNVTQIKPEK